MAARGSMAYMDEFLENYQKAVLDTVDLPAALRGYTLVSCLKKNARSVFLLSDGAGKRVILKAQPLGQPPSLRDEFELLNSVSHPQIPSAICFFEENQTEFLIREYVAGVSLKELISEGAPPSEHTCISIAISLCEVLRYLHTQTPPIIHRDIKPQNVILSSDGSCHLIDFGTARHFKEQETEDTVFMGTRATAAPEQFGYCQTDVRSDVYGVGMLLRFLLTGGYDSSRDETIRYGLRKIISRCTAFDPQKRFASADTLAGALRRAGRPEKRRRVVGGVSVGVAFLALVLAFVFRLPPHSRPTADFQDPLLAGAVRQELKLSANEPIPSSQLEEVTKLILCGRETMSSLRAHDDVAWMLHDVYITAMQNGSIADLGELKQLPNLRTLVLDYQQITDISALAGLPLEYLSLCGNQITDLSPLTQCKELQVLNVCQNPVKDGSVLAGLPLLVSANISQTNITEIPPLANSAVRQLYLSGTPINSYAPLTECARLQVLEATDLDSAALNTVLQLASLQRLSLHQGTRLDFTKFSSLQNLRELDVYSCNYDSLAGLEQLPCLKYLNVGEGGITDVSVFAQFPMLSELELRQDVIADFSPLLDCKHLSLVVLEEAQRSQAEEQLAGAPFRLEIRPQ